jgi:predicted phosphoribosyltransferase
MERETGMGSYKNRREAGKQLADRLSTRPMESVVLLAIPRGGIPVALPSAERLGVPLGVVPIRRLPVPWAKDIEVGYVTDTGALHLNQPLIGQVRLTPQEIYPIAKREQKILQQELLAWGATPPSNLSSKTVVIIDEGLHTGWTMFSAVETAKGLGAQRIIAVAPVCHFRAQRFVGGHCDAIISLVTEDIPLFQVANYYQEFPEVSDEEIRSALRAAPTQPSQTAA